MQVFKDYARVYNLIYADKPYKKEADFVYNWAKKPKTILELGCGTGNHAKHLCKNALVFGVDTSKEMLEQAYEHKRIHYILTKIDENLAKLPVFDCVLAMFNVLGYVLLEDCLPYLPIKKGGYFIFDVWDASKFKDSPAKPTVKEFKDGYKISVPRHLSKRMVEIDYTVIYGSQYFIEKHLVEGYFKDDIERLCKKHGYKIISTKDTDTWTIWYKLQKL